MSLNPAPSRTIAFYMARMFIVRTLAFLVALVVILQVLDLMDQSTKILAVPGNDGGTLWHYVMLRAPQLITTFLPFSVLLATLVTLTTLNQNSEIVIMKAAGISAHQILLPLVAAALGVAAVHFTFNELVLVKTNAELDVWQAANYGATPADVTARQAWVREGERLYHAENVTGHDATTKLNDVTVYDRAKDRLVTVWRAKTAVPVKGGWTLNDVRRFDVQRGVQTTLPSMTITTDITPIRFTATDPKADQLSFGELRHAINEVEAAGRSDATLVAALYHKISGPLSACLMPILGSVAAFGLARSGRLFIRAVIGMMLGFAYFVADNFMMAMGQFGAAPPWLAAWAPFLLFLLIGEAVLFRTEE